jgi:2-polyprenyl-6-methoxyphenol hydroxylase-like FAD-dependent oxidoreductase
LNRVVIVGGGTAGWLSAALLAADARRYESGTRTVTLIESPDIPTVGVGEGTWPTMRATLQAIGLDEDHMLRQCDGAFKQGSRFDGWVTGEDGDSYYHPFTAPPDGDPRDLVAAWKAAAPDSSFAEAVSAQPAVCQQSLAPKQAGMAPYAGALNYAYHLDAGKLAACLTAHATQQLGVVHRRGEVTAVEADPDGNIAAVVTRDGWRIEGDIFIDCSGHRALLIGGHYGVEWIDRSDGSANDRALAAQVPVAPGSPVASQTIGTAHRAGWIWDIGLPTRRGVGCVYSSKFIDDERAEAILRDYIARSAPNVDAEAIAPRRLTFPTGHRATFWRGNCVAIGLSSGFIEPLESSAIVMIELAANALIADYPARAEMLPVHAERFNSLFRERWDRVVDFLKLHYLLSRREEPYWRAQRDPTSVSPRLQSLLELWRDQPPSPIDFPLAEEIFPGASHQYVWYGMGGVVPANLPRASEAMLARLGQLRQRGRGLLSALPPNRVLLDRLASAEPEEAFIR